MRRRRRAAGTELGGEGGQKDAFRESAGRKSGRPDSAAWGVIVDNSGNTEAGVDLDLTPSLPPSFFAFLHNLVARSCAPAHALSTWPPGGVGRARFTHYRSSRAVLRAEEVLSKYFSRESVRGTLSEEERIQDIS